jgi:hypothetical protein
MRAGDHLGQAVDPRLASRLVALDLGVGRLQPLLILGKPDHADPGNGLPGSNAVDLHTIVAQGVHLRHGGVNGALFQCAERRQLVLFDSEQFAELLDRSPSISFR